MSSSLRTALIAVFILLVVAALAWVALRSGEQPEQAVLEPTVVQTATPVPATPTARLAGITLATSDAVVREMVAELSSRPELAKWLASEDLVRRFVASVANVADGASPRRHLSMLDPGGRFEVIEKADGTLVAAPGTFRRWDRLAGIVSAVDAEGAVALLGELEPLVRDAWAEIAPPDRSFRAALVEAIDNLLAVQVPSDELPLERKVVTYTYADLRLEGLSPAQRQLLRLGPDNARAVQAKLREIRALL